MQQAALLAHSSGCLTWHSRLQQGRLRSAAMHAATPRPLNARSCSALLPTPLPAAAWHALRGARLQAHALMAGGGDGSSGDRSSLVNRQRDAEPDRSNADDTDLEPAESSRRDDAPARRPPNQLERLLLALVSAAVQTLSFFWRLIPKRLRLFKLSGWAVAFAVAFAFVSGAIGPGSSVSVIAPQEVVYSQFLDAVKGGHVRAVRFDDPSERVYFDLQSQPTASGSRAAADVSKLATATPTPRQFFAKKIDDPGLINVLMAAGVEFGAMRGTVTGALLRVFGTAIAVWIPLMPLFFIMRRAFNGKTNSRAKKSGGKPTAPAITFRDVAGVEAAKEELREVVACLKDSQRYARLNAKMPSGVLLCGAPGTGKTLLAKAVAGEAGVPFFAASASEFVELFVGRGAARIRDLFAEARKKAPCVVFIDELDAVGGKRGLGLNEERDQTLNQLLTELDGFEGRTGVLLLAATNRAEVVVPLPDKQGRADILAVHLRGTPLPLATDKPLLCRTIAGMSRGFSGAELANVVNEAALLAGRAGKDAIELAELVEGVQRTRYGMKGVGTSMLPSLQRLAAPSAGLARSNMPPDKGLFVQPFFADMASMAVAATRCSQA